MLNLDAHTLWAQQAVRTGRLGFNTPPDEGNHADTLTDHIGPGGKLLQFAKLLNCQFLDGRAESAPKARAQEADKVNIPEADHPHGTDEGA